MGGVSKDAELSGPDPQTVAPALLAWWHVYGRTDLPWQQNISAYRVWISEIMLQQTQVMTVARYFSRFMAEFPDVWALAEAPLDRVLHLWSGLGYYARARNLHRTAQQVCAEHGGEFPTDVAALVALPGIGRSTAGAIVSIACGGRAPILDGNVKRVLARLYNVRGWPGTAAVGRELWEYAEQCTPQTDVPAYTQAIMDLGATLCRRSSPDCERCPFTQSCAARAAGTVSEVPGKKPRRQRPRRSITALVISRPDGAVLLEQRPPEGIWGGLYGFPEVAKNATASSEQADAGWCRRQLGIEPARRCEQPVVSHTFTHFDLDIHPLRLELAEEPRAVMEPGRWLWYKLSEPAQVGLAAPVSRLLDSLGEET